MIKKIIMMQIFTLVFAVLCVTLLIYGLRQISVEDIGSGIKSIKEDFNKGYDK